MVEPQNLTTYPPREGGDPSNYLSPTTIETSPPSLPSANPPLYQNSGLDRPLLHSTDNTTITIAAAAVTMMRSTPLVTLENPGAMRVLHIDTGASEPGPRADGVVYHGEGHDAPVDETRPVHGQGSEVVAPNGREAQCRHYEEPPSTGDCVDGA